MSSEPLLSEHGLFQGPMRSATQQQMNAEPLVSEHGLFQGPVRSAAQQQMNEYSAEQKESPVQDISDRPCSLDRTAGILTAWVVGRTDRLQ